MRFEFTNQSETRSTAMHAIEAVIAISTAMLASVFVVAAVLSQIGVALIA